MQEHEQNLFRRLAEAPWHVAGRTFGNDHATLVGILVNWWISGDRETRSVLEGGPSFGYHEKGVGGGLCDAVFCENDQAVGILEVEGTRLPQTVDKVGKFFDALHQDFRTLRFAVLVSYAYSPVGRGPDRHLPPVEQPNLLESLARLSAGYPEKWVALITLDKVYERQLRGPRFRNEWYWGRPASINGILFKEGRQIGRQAFWNS